MSKKTTRERAEPPAIEAEAYVPPQSPLNATPHCGIDHWKKDNKGKYEQMVGLPPPAAEEPAEAPVRDGELLPELLPDPEPEPPPLPDLGPPRRRKIWDRD